VVGQRLWRHDPATRAETSWEVQAPLGSIALCRSHGAILAMGKGFHRLDFSAGQSSTEAASRTDLMATSGSLKNELTRWRGGRRLPLASRAGLTLTKGRGTNDLEANRRDGGWRSDCIRRGLR